MSQFDAIERVLRARREEAEHDEAAGHDRPESASSAAGDSGGRESAPAAAKARVAVGPAPDKSSAADERDIRPPGRRRRTVLLVCAVIVVVIAATATALAATHATRTNAPSATATTPPHPAPTPDEIQAARWVADNVGPQHTVACDTNLCALTQGSGMPATSLVVVGTDFTQLERADVVISTALIRSEFGAQLTAVTSPEPLASFGYGNERVDITAVAVDGTSDYASHLAADHKARRQVGTVVAHNPHITTTGQSVTELTSGDIDSRLCSLLTLIGTTHTITVISFSGTGPGAGPDIPETDVLISFIDSQPADGTTPETTALLALIDAQQAPYRPMATTHTADGLKISFSQPGPFGLIAGTTP